MAKEKNVNDVHKWVEDYFEKKEGTGVGPVHAGRMKMHFDDRNITSVNEAEKYAKERMKEGTFLNKNIHTALQKHLGEGVEAEEAKAKEKEAEAEKEKAEAEEEEAKAGEKTEVEETETQKAAAAAYEAQKKLAEEELKDIKRRRKDERKGFGPSDTKRRSRWKYEGTGLKGLEGARWIPIIFAILVWIFDFYLGFDGFRIGMQLRRFSLGGFSVLAPALSMGWGDYLIGIFLNPIFWALITLILILKWGRKREIISWSLFIYLFMVIVFGSGWKGNGLMHIIMALLFYFLVLSKYYEDNIPKAKYVICVVLFIDFFAYGIIQDFFITNEVIKYIFSNRLIIPIWFYVSVVYAYKIRSSFMTTILILGIILVNAFSVYGGIVDVRDFSKIIDPQQKEDFKDYFTRSKENFQNWAGQLFRDIRISAEQQLEYATGGYYKGRVEENQDEQLGVYLENIEAADKTFYENEQVVVWGDLEARTLDQPIYVYMICESGDAKGNIVPETLANPEYLGNPEKGYKIEKLEQIGFECRFNPGQLETGTNSIKIKAEFNFETLAFLKTYFMDIERIRALRRENIDPLAQYGIKDKTPTAVFTNGPVRLGMGTVDPPLGINAKDNAYSYIGVTVERQWQGQIKKITGLTIQLPSMLQLESSNNLFCREDFKKTGENDKGYTIYTMTEDGIKKIKTPITQFVSRRCSITVPKASDVLEKMPVTTYYYRANANYIYEIEEQISIYIKSVLGEKTKLSGCNVNCTDSDGCICNADNCNIAKGNDVGKGFTCNNYKAGASYSKRDIEEDFEYIDALQEYIIAMIYLNKRCLEANTGIVNNSIDDSKDLSDSEKKELKNFVMDGCENRSYRFFEITEGLIVDKVEKGIDVFEVLESKDLGTEKTKANNEKTEFHNLLGTTIEHFNENYDYVKTEKSDANIKTIETKRTELGNINFD